MRDRFRIQLDVLTRYAPIIPMVLVNGSEGIGHEWPRYPCRVFQLRLSRESPPKTTTRHRLEYFGAKLQPLGYHCCWAACSYDEMKGYRDDWSSFETSNQPLKFIFNCIICLSPSQANMRQFIKKSLGLQCYSLWRIGTQNFVRLVTLSQKLTYTIADHCGCWELQATTVGSQQCGIPI